MMRQIVSAACGLWIAIAGAVEAQQGGPDGPGPGEDPGGLSDRTAPRPTDVRGAKPGSAATASQIPPAVTSQQGIVVELYTSQGCSSCPPADAVFEKLVNQPGVIPLALHVDYWDYIGWRDTFGNARFTDRQKAYARAAGERMIYTPQMIVSGQDRIVGSEPEELAAALARKVAAQGSVSLTIERAGDRVVIRAAANPPLSQAVVMQLVRYQPQQTVEIEGGENQGQIVTYSNIVTDWQRLGEWPGNDPLEVEADAPGPNPVVVILQNQGPSNIVAAAALK